MRIGSIWSTPDRKEFIIEDIKIVDGKTWIHYNNKATNQKYSCYVEAFVSRFHEKINNG